VANSDELQNLALIVPDQGLGKMEDWRNGVDATVMVEKMGRFHPSLQALARFASFPIPNSTCTSIALIWADSYMWVGKQKT